MCPECGRVTLCLNCIGYVSLSHTLGSRHLSNWAHALLNERCTVKAKRPFQPKHNNPLDQTKNAYLR